MPTKHNSFFANLHPTIQKESYMKRGKEVSVRQRAKSVSGRIVVISMISAILDVILHALLAPTYNYDYPASFFIRSGLFKPAAGIALWIIFVLLGVVFVFTQKESPGCRLTRGLRFGISFGGLWLIGVVGMSIFFASPLRHELLGGACDCTALIVLGALLGLFTVVDRPPAQGGSLWKVVPAAIIIALFSILGQYSAFLLMNGTQYFRIDAPATLIWTVVLGVWMGALYRLLRPGLIKESSPAKRSIFFGGVIIGVDWIFFNLFALLFVAMPVIDPIILSVFNIASIIAGMLVFEILFCKKNNELQRADRADPFQM